MSNEMSYDSQQIQEFRGLKLFEVPIFTIFNPRNAVVIFSVDCKKNDLKIKMAPAIPNNPAINSRGPVPKNVKVYDYDKQVVSNFTDIDSIDFLNFLKSKFLSTSTEYVGWLTSSMNTLYSISQYLSNVQNVDNNILMSINENLETIKNYYNSINSSVENQFGLFRKSTSNGDKAWNFVYDPGTNMLHINVMYGPNKDRINTTISAKMALRLMNVIESYVNGFVGNQLITNLSTELSNDASIVSEKLDRIEGMLNFITSRFQQ